MEIKIIIDDKLVSQLKKIVTGKNTIFIIAVIFFLMGLVLFSGDLPKPYTFQTGDVIYAEELNKNFDALFSRKLESLTDVLTEGIEPGQILKWDGSDWCTADDVYSEGVIWTLNGDNIYFNNGNIGIGTTSPDVRLDVNGIIRGQLDTYRIGGTINASGDCFECNPGDTLISAYVSGLDNCSNNPCDADLGIDLANQRICAGTNDHTGWVAYGICIRSSQ